jgi:hypothetical protein
MAGQNYCVVGGCLLSLSLCRRGFQDLLKVRTSSLFILCGCISSSIASLSFLVTQLTHNIAQLTRTLTIEVAVSPKHELNQFVIACCDNYVSGSVLTPGDGTEQQMCMQTVRGNC